MRLRLPVRDLTRLADLLVTAGHVEAAQRLRNLRSDRYGDRDPNDVVVVEAGDEVARLYEQDARLRRYIEDVP